MRILKFSKGHNENCLQLKKAFHTKLRQPFTRQSPKIISGSKSVSKGASFTEDPWISAIYWKWLKQDYMKLFSCQLLLKRSVAFVNAV